MNQKKLPTDTITRKDVTLILDSINELKKEYKILKEDFNEYRNENMNRLDEVMAELQSIREDNTIGTYQIRELRENVDDHEKRITKLEKKHVN